MTQNNFNPNVFMQQLNQMRQSYKGDPMQQIRQALSNGQISQQQYSVAVQQAQNIMRMLGIKQA